MIRFYDPFREIDALRRELERTFESFTPAPRRGAFLPGRAARRYPMINITEHEGGFRVEALAPGVNPASIQISVLGNQLTIAGEKPSPGDNVAPEAYHRNERAAGKFVRTVALPVAVDPDKVQADYRNGVLAIILPKSPAAMPRQIAVNVN